MNLTKYLPPVLTRTVNTVAARISAKAALGVAASVYAALMKTRAGWTWLTTVSLQTATNDGYKALVWVYRCVTTLGTSTGSVPWYVVQVSADGSEKIIPGHPAAILLENPNPYQSRGEFFQLMMIYLSLAGNDYIEIVFANGKPKWMFHLRPDYCCPIPDEAAFISGYKFDAKVPGRKPIIFDPGEVIHFKYSDPLDPFIGMSPITAARRTLESDTAAIAWNKTVFDNSAIASGVLEVPTQQFSPEQKAETTKMLDEEFTRENLNRPMVMWGGMKWTQLGMDHKDMDWFNQRKTNKYETCAVFGVPPGVVGANEDPTYSNYEIARQAFWEDTIITNLDWIRSRLNARLMPFYNDPNATKGGKRFELRYDLAKVPALRKPFLDSVAAAEKLVGMGHPINHVNQRLNLGLPMLEWGETSMLKSGVIPIDLVLAGGAPLADDPADDDPSDDPNDDGTDDGSDDPNNDPGDDDGTGDGKAKRKPRRRSTPRDY